VRVPGAIRVRDVEGRILLRTRCQYISVIHSVLCLLRTEQAASSQIKPAPVGVPLDRCGAENSDKRNALYKQKIIVKFYTEIAVDAVRIK